jgi:hypothetical protein
MRSSVALVVAVLASTVAATSSATAAVAKPFWTTTQTEQALLDSEWFADNALIDATCVGRGRAKPTPTNDQAFRLLKCTFTAQDWFTDDVSSFTAGVRVVANPNRFVLFAFSDESFDPNSDCYQQPDVCPSNG